MDIGYLTVCYRLMWIKLEIKRLRGFEDDHPRGEDGRFTSKSDKEVAFGENSGIIEVSAKGANEFQVKGFYNKQKLNNHWKDHRSEGLIATSNYLFPILILPIPHRFILQRKRTKNFTPPLM